MPPLLSFPELLRRILVGGFCTRMASSQGHFVLIFFNEETLKQFVSMERRHPVQSKVPPKFELKRETVRRLDREELSLVVGGATAACCIGCNTGADLGIPGTCGTQCKGEEEPIEA